MYMHNTNFNPDMKVCMDFYVKSGSYDEGIPWQSDWLYLKRQKVPLACLEPIITLLHVLIVQTDKFTAGLSIFICREHEEHWDRTIV